MDVDETLLLYGMTNESLLSWLRKRKADGFELVLWSARGRHHAEQVAGMCKTLDLFDFILSKPGYIVDNDGWNWARFVKRVTRENVDVGGYVA